MSDSIRPFIIGVAGGTASGKTWLCRFLKEELGDEVETISQDWYYRCRLHLPSEERSRVNFDHPEAFDMDLLVEHIDKLSKGCAIEAPQYDFSLHCRRPEKHAVKPARFLVIEGLYTLYDPRLRQLFTASIFVDVPADIRLMRRIRRDIEERGRTVGDILAQYEQSVRPMHTAFLEKTAAFAERVWRPLEEPDFPEKFIASLRERPGVRGHVRALF